MKDDLVHHVWISLGSNLGDRSGQLDQAREQMAQACGRMIRVSGIYESSPLGFESDHLFFNQCLLLETHLLPVALLQQLLAIERKMGRMRRGKEVMDRPIDLDILFYDDLVIHSGELEVPHPRMASRKFVLQPLCEISADKRDPLTDLTVSEMLAQCEDPSFVKRIFP